MLFRSQHANIVPHFTLLNETNKLKDPIIADVFRLPRHLNMQTGEIYYQYFEVVFDKNRQVDCIGIGNTDASHLRFEVIHEVDNTEISTLISIPLSGNGLYYIGQYNGNKPFNASKIIIISGNVGETEITNATYIGRLGAGLGVRIPTNIMKEPGFNSTATSRTTLSGQIIPGHGGYIFKTVFLDSRYKIDKLIMNEINEGYQFIGKDYPFFLDLSDEAYKLPFNKMYANDRNQKSLRFESGVMKFLYSRRWEFEERF